jgi:hypothetical protein
MAHVITFSTDAFDVSKEDANPINAIAGQAVLNWIRGQLEGRGYTTTKPDTEDWGWYIDVEGRGSAYLVGASGEKETSATCVDWTIQIHKHRTLTDKLTGRNKLTSDDPLSVLLETCVRSDPRFRDVDVDKNA